MLVSSGSGLFLPRCLHYWPIALFLFAVVSIAAVLPTTTMTTTTRTTTTAAATTSSSVYGMDLQTLILQRLSNMTNRCANEENEQYPFETGLPPEKCPCPDPTIPEGRTQIPAWMKHHTQLSAEAAHAFHKKDIDVVLIGDSITERWRGTKGFGTSKGDAGYKRTFDELFGGTTNGASLNGLALGTAQGTTFQTLWQLQNGWLPDTLHPKIFVLLIGTNDLGLRGCSKHTTLLGILNLVQYLRQKRPQVPILVHGLLPRVGSFGRGGGNILNHKRNLELAGYWSQIQWINRELQQFCAHQPPGLYYMDSGRLFFTSNNNDNKKRNFRSSRKRGDDGEDQIQRDLISDGLHPTVQGCRQWGPHMVQRIQQILKK